MKAIFIIAEILLLITLCVVKGSFEVTSKQRLFIIVGNAVYVVLMICALLSFGVAETLEPDYAGWVLAAALEIIIGILALIVLFGVVGLFSRSKAFYYLCASGVGAICFVVNMRLLLLEMREYADLLMELSKGGVYYLIGIALMLFMFLSARHFKPKQRG